MNSFIIVKEQLGNKTLRKKSLNDLLTSYENYTIKKEILILILNIYEKDYILNIHNNYYMYTLRLVFSEIHL